MSSFFEVVPVSDLQAGDMITEPLSGVLAEVQSVGPGPLGWRVVLGQVWCLHFDVEAETPIRRQKR